MTPAPVLHVITGLSTGGAERMLLKLVRATDAARFTSHVASLTDRGTLADAIERHGVPVEALGMTRKGVWTAAIRLRRLIERVKPEIIVGWMYHANLAALCAAGLARSGAKLLWNIRHTPYRLRDEKTLTAMLIRVSALVSSRPDGVIYNSRLSLARHRQLGYRPRRAVVIPNGFDLAEFSPSASARRDIRRECGIPVESPVVGHVARFHPMKDHQSFLRAAAAIRRRHPAARFVLAGRGVTRQNAFLRDLCESHGLADAVSLLGERRDVPDILSALDVLCLSSAWGEGFPNVLGEAMACGVPCVTTDVGDSAAIVGDTGLVVERGDATGIAERCCHLLELDARERQALGEAARTRVGTEFAVARVARMYESEFEHTLADRLRHDVAPVLPTI